MHFARRFDGEHKGYDGTTRRGKNGTDWTGVVHLHEDRLSLPLKWRKPQRVFVDSMSDLFHPTVPDEYVDKVFAVMALASRHTFIVLTKRPERMRAYTHQASGRIADTIIRLRRERGDTDMAVVPLPHVQPGTAWWPLPNVWLGTSVEDQAAADKRIPHLLETPAAVRFLSCEPLLGPVDLWGAKYPAANGGLQGAVTTWPGGVDWVITGGESGHGARPADPDWFRQIRDQCKATGVAYFHKQAGEWLRCGPEVADDEMAGGVYVPHPFGSHIRTSTVVYTPDGKNQRKLGEGVYMERVGKKASGRRLDGREHSAFPEEQR